ncbi:hypothetical protein BLNAU_7564 [Blattamonas nauphoetae]|uniref:Tail specific protease domain-containing protein n=1 Tax=Blattamonas nauphoetae TaxID=2049346 RepID=A0ABQ9Y0Z6_9EUKA|nr:hypothetical protein BLNAU_7564 [Blattamonas nauphoetae]
MISLADFILIFCQNINIVRQMRVPRTELSLTCVGCSELLEEWIEMYVFLDIYQNPPHPYSGTNINIQKELQNLGQLTFDSDYDFQISVFNLFKSLRDSHTLYIPPECYQHFQFVFPFSIDTSLDSDGNMHFVLAKNQFSEAFADSTGTSLKKYLGKKIESIQGRDPLAWLSWFGDQHSFSSKDRQVRLNSVLQGEMWVQNAATCTLPDSLLLSGLTIQLAHQGVLKIPFFGTVLEAVNGSDQMLSEWKAKNEGSKSRFRPSDRWGTSNQEGDHLRVISPSEDSIPSISHQRWTTLLTRLKQKPASPQTQPCPVPNGRSAERDTVRISDNETCSVQTIVSRDRCDEMQVYLIEFSDDSARYGLIRFESFSPSDEILFISIFESAFRTLTEMNTTHIVIDLRSNIGGSIPLGFRLLQFFSSTSFPLLPQYDVRHSEPTSSLLSVSSDPFAIEPRDWESRERLRGKTWYWPGRERGWWKEKVQQDRYERNSAKTRTDGIIRNNSMSSPFTSLSPSLSYTTQLYSSLFSFTLPPLSSSSSPSRSSRASTQPRLNNSEPNLSLFSPPPAVYTFSPQHTLILTDGLCGSTCAVLCLELQQKGKARVIGTGGEWLNGNPVSTMLSSSYPGGCVMQADILKEMFPEADFPPLPPTSSVLSFTFMEVFPSDWNVRKKNPDTPLEFVPISVDARIPHWPRNSQIVEGDEKHGMCGLTDKAELASALKKAKPFFNVCFDWEFTTAETEDCPLLTKHGVMGHRCGGSDWKANGERCLRNSHETKSSFTTTSCGDGGKGWSGECDLVGCEEGYYLNALGACTSIPSRASLRHTVPFFFIFLFGIFFA